MLFSGTTSSRLIRLNHFQSCAQDCCFIFYYHQNLNRDRKFTLLSTFIVIFCVSNRMAESQNNFSGEEPQAGPVPKLDWVLRPLVLSFSRVGDSTCSLGNPCQCLTTLMVKYFPYIIPEFPLLQLATIVPVVPVCVSGKGLPPSSL